MLEKEVSAQDKLKLYVEISIKDLERMKPLMPIFFDFWSLSVRKKNIKQAIKGHYQYFIDFIEPLIQDGIDWGEFQSVDDSSGRLKRGIPADVKFK